MLSVQSQPIDDFLGKLISRIENQDAKNALPLVEVSQFAIKIGTKISDPKQLTTLFNKIRILSGNSLELTRDILSEIIRFYDFWEMENDLKNDPPHGTSKTRKAFIRRMGKTLTTIITELNPDPARFDLPYIAELIQLRASEKKDVVEHLKECVKQRATKRTNPKGFASERNFIQNVLSKVSKHDSHLKENAILKHIAEILTILTGKPQSRQSVYNKLAK